MADRDTLTTKGEVLSNDFCGSRDILGQGGMTLPKRQRVVLLPDE